MAAHLAYTIFEDLAATVIRKVHHASGRDAESLLRAFRDVKGSTPAEGDMIAGCRIDRIGSEDNASKPGAVNV